MPVGARRARAEVGKVYRRWRGNGDHPWVARRSGRFYLGFDDGPDPEWTPRVLDELARIEVRATFFVIAERARETPSLVARTLAEGHDVELHCMRHLSHTAGREAIEADTDEALAVLAELGVRPTRWRLPNLAGDWWAPEVARARGLRLIGASADPRDWTGDDVHTMLRRLERDLRPGRIAVLHDAIGARAPRTSSANTVALLEPLVRRLRSAGVEPSPLSSGRSYSWVFIAQRGVHRTEAIEVEVVRERDLSGADHFQVCRLLGEEISRGKDAYRERGWRRLEPEYRVIARSGGEVVGQVSAFVLKSRPELNALGFGDFAVHADHRRRGIALAIGRDMLLEAQRREAELMLGDSVAFAKFAEVVGWSRVERFELFYERDGACHWHPNWWMWRRSPEPSGRIELEEGDF